MENKPVVRPPDRAPEGFTRVVIEKHQLKGAADWQLKSTINFPTPMMDDFRNKMKSSPDDALRELYLNGKNDPYDTLLRVAREYVQLQENELCIDANAIQRLMDEKYGGRSQLEKDLESYRKKLDQLLKDSDAAKKEFEKCEKAKLDYLEGADKLSQRANEWLKENESFTLCEKLPHIKGLFDSVKNAIDTDAHLGQKEQITLDVSDEVSKSMDGLDGDARRNAITHTTVYLCYEISSHLAGEIRKLDGFATDWSEAKKNIYKHSAKAWESSISRQTGIANEIKSDINLLENLDGIINDIDVRNEQLNDNYSPKKAKNLKKETEKILNLYEKCQKKPGAYLVVAKNHLAQLEVIISYSDGLPSLYKNAAKIIERHKSCIDAISKLDAREREVRGEISFLEHKLSDMGDDSHLKRILEEKLSQLGDVRGITATINGAINPAYNGLAGKGAQYPASVGKPYIFTKKVPLVGQDTSFGQDKIDAFIEKLKEKFPNFGEDGKYCNQAGNFEKALRAIGEAYAENGFKLTLNSVCEIQGLAKKCHIQDIPGGRKVIRVGIDSTLKYRLLLDCTDAESPMIIFVGNKGDSKNYIKNRGYMNASNDGLFELLKRE